MSDQDTLAKLIEEARRLQREGHVAEFFDYLQRLIDWHEKAVVGEAQTEVTT